MSEIRTFNKKAILSRIDRLERVAPAERLINAFLELKDGKYKLDCRLWNGVYGSGIQSIITVHDSFEEAKQAFEQMQTQYPSNENVILFVDDLDEELLFMDDDSYRELLKDMSDTDLEVLASEDVPDEVVKKILRKAGV